MKTTKPLSLITVTLNNLQGLKKTWESVGHQTEQDFEWLVIDGGSNDDSLSFLQEISANFISESDNGLYDAMNKGVKHCDGAYILFLNAGDALYSEQTADIILKHLKSDADFYYGDSAEQSGGQIYLRPARAPHFGKNGMFTSHQAMIYKRDLLKDMVFDGKTYPISADYALTCEYLKRAKTIDAINAPLCLAESGGISQQNALTGRLEQFRIRKRLGISNPLENSATFIKQSGAWMMRALVPALYWRMRCAGNTSSGSWQTHSPHARPESQA